MPLDFGPGVVQRTPLIPLMGSVGQPRHERWHPALQEYMLGFSPGQEPLLPRWGDPILVPACFSLAFILVL